MPKLKHESVKHTCTGGGGAGRLKDDSLEWSPLLPPPPHGSVGVDISVQTDLAPSSLIRPSLNARLLFHFHQMHSDSSWFSSTLTNAS